MGPMGPPGQARKAPAPKTDDIGKQQAQQTRGAYLAQAGNCMGCHTAQGGRPYAGGHVLATSIGTFVTPNITPDRETGIGLWNEEDFWHALHEGKARNGSPLYPAFPYTEYTKVTREDSDAIFAYLQSLPPIQQRNPPNRIQFSFQFSPPHLCLARLLLRARRLSSPRLQRVMNGTVAHIWYGDSGIAMLATQPGIRSAQARVICWEEVNSWAPTGTRPL